MTTKVNGRIEQGIWFSADVRFVQVTATGGAFLADLTAADAADDVNTSLEKAVRALATRGTVIGLNVVSATVFEVIMDHAQAFDDAAVVTEVQDLIDSIDAPSDLSATAIVAVAGFVGAVPGTPA